MSEQGKKKESVSQNWLIGITLLLIASFLINIFLYCISVTQRTEIYNLGDEIAEKNRIIKSYKIKTND